VRVPRGVNKSQAQRYDGRTTIFSPEGSSQMFLQTSLRGSLFHLPLKECHRFASNQLVSFILAPPT
jgi:hypothetical protein